MEDAQSLVSNRRFVGGIYLGGYAVECLLKVAVGNRSQSLRLEGGHEHHDLEQLLADSGLAWSLQKEPSLRAVFSAVVTEWSPHLRYRTSLLTKTNSAFLFAQIEELYEWLVHNTR